MTMPIEIQTDRTAPPARTWRGRLGLYADLAATLVLSVALSAGCFSVLLLMTTGVNHMEETLASMPGWYAVTWGLLCILGMMATGAGWFLIMLKIAKHKPISNREFWMSGWRRLNSPWIEEPPAGRKPRFWERGFWEINPPNGRDDGGLRYAIRRHRNVHAVSVLAWLAFLIVATAAVMRIPAVATLVELPVYPMNSETTVLTFMGAALLLLMALYAERQERQSRRELNARLNALENPAA